MAEDSFSNQFIDLSADHATQLCYVASGAVGGAVGRVGGLTGLGLGVLSGLLLARIPLLCGTSAKPGLLNQVIRKKLSLGQHVPKSQFQSFAKILKDQYGVPSDEDALFLARLAYLHAQSTQISSVSVPAPDPRTRQAIQHLLSKSGGLFSPIA